MNPKIKDMPSKEKRMIAAARFNETFESLSEKLKQRVSSTPKNYQGSYARALAGEANLRQSIKAKCQECVGFENVRDEVGNCKVFTCPLWHHRPYTKKQ